MNKLNEINTTVVLATYNGKDFLEKQVESILQQTLLPTEIIFVDDGSTDGTRDLLLSIQKSYSGIIKIELVFREKNLGYILNFVDGIKRAKGDIIFLCDQDDEWHIDKVKNTLSFFSLYKDCIAVHSNTSIIDRVGNIIRENAQDYRLYSKKLSLNELVKKVNYPGMALAFKKEKIASKLLELVDSGIKLPTHDWVICFLATIQDGFYISDETLTYRRYTGNNVALQLASKNLSVENRIEGIDIYIKLYEFLSDYESKFLLEKQELNKYILNAIKRKKYLGNRNILLWGCNFINILRYPSIRAYFADLISIIKSIKK
ncbi:glycosyltransferase [Bisgaard Taxon 10/6]|uniref:Glycosyltransferase n=1 Tax=Exercitatus varius TaxID=67857 RepID=A0ABT6ERU2_9PAST|nr:glycosyltransferase [Exercitatus varius]MDG2945454.1 glycosyltransferase [Exercitatus varius]